MTVEKRTLPNVKTVKSITTKVLVLVSAILFAKVLLLTTVFRSIVNIPDLYFKAFKRYNIHRQTDRQM